MYDQPKLSEFVATSDATRPADVVWLHLCKAERQRSFHPLDAR